MFVLVHFFLFVVAVLELSSCVRPKRRNCNAISLIHCAFIASNPFCYCPFEKFNRNYRCDTFVQPVSCQTRHNLLLPNSPNVQSFHQALRYTHDVTQWAQCSHETQKAIFFNFFVFAILFPFGLSRVSKRCLHPLNECPFMCFVVLTFHNRKTLIKSDTI